MSPVVHEVAVGAGLGYHGGATVVAGGVGGSVGYKLRVGEHLVAFVDVGPRLFLVPCAEVDVGAAARLPLGKGWSVRGGAEVAGMLGGVVRRITEEDPAPMRGPPFAARIVLAPLEHQREQLVIRALQVSLGTGLEAPFRTLAVGVDLLEVGWTF